MFFSTLGEILERCEVPGMMILGLLVAWVVIGILSAPFYGAKALYRRRRR